MRELAGLLPPGALPVGAVTATAAIEPVAVTATLVDVAADALPEQAAHAPAAPLTAPAPAAAVPAPAISATAQLLSHWLSAALPAADVPAPLQALLPGPEVQPPKIAAALHQAVTHSGLFYESHLGEWVEGKRSVDSLQQEPQARLPTAAGTADADAAAIVRQQLDLLDTQQLNWRGELWPGLPVTLQLVREGDRQKPGRHARPDDPDEVAWRSTLVSTLPHLGEVTVRLSLTDKRLQLKLQSPSDGSARLLLRQIPSLGRALQSAGIALDSVSSHGQKAG